MISGSSWAAWIIIGIGFIFTPVDHVDKWFDTNQPWLGELIHVIETAKKAWHVHVGSEKM